MTKKYVNNLVYEVIGAAIEVHRYLGPGLLEGTYQRCMREELDFRGIKYQAELVTRLIYRGKDLKADLRCDFLIENCLVVELKSAEAIIPVYHAQLLTYMKLLNVPKGLLINFNCDHIYKHGQKTMVNQLYQALPE